MSTLTILPSGKSINAEVGKSLLELIQAAGVEIENNGKGSDHIFVQSGRKSVSKIAAEENAKLDTMVGVGSKSRLASHATVTGEEDITVEVLGFSSGL